MKSTITTRNVIARTAWTVGLIVGGLVALPGLLIVAAGLGLYFWIDDNENK